MNMNQDYSDMMEQIKNDPDITNYASFATSSYQIQNKDGELETIKIENGNFETFPLEYVSGGAPQNENEIALSAMNAKELNQTLGSIISIFSDTQEYRLKVCGIYQDITKGGKTAKAMLPYESKDILWYVVNINIEDDSNLSEKIHQYTEGFPSAKVTDMKDYINQTFGSIISGLYTVITLSIILTIAVSLLITALFFKMLIMKEKVQIAVMYSMGFSDKDIKLQYAVRALSVLALGIIIGSIAALTVGPNIAGKLLAGISQMHFIINPLISYLLCPLLLLLSVGTAIAISSRPVKNIGVMTIQNGR